MWTGTHDRKRKVLSNLRSGLNTKQTRRSGNEQYKNTIKIDGTKGDVIGVGVSGSGNVIGKNIVVGSGTINVSQTQLQQIPNEYATALKEFSEQINNQLKGKQLPEEQIKSVNNSLEEWQKKFKT